VMLPLSWDHQGPLVHGDQSQQCLVLQPPDESCETAVRRLRGLLRSGIVLLHDNARPRTARAPAETIRASILSCLPHSSYWRDFAPCDCHILGPPKGALGEKALRCSEEVQEAVLTTKGCFLRKNRGFSAAQKYLHWARCRGMFKHNKAVPNLCPLN
jgi:hypothetical protein